MNIQYWKFNGNATENESITINNKKMSHTKIMWVQGEPGSGKTTLKHFLSKTYLEAVMYEMDCAKNIIEASDAVMQIINGDENAPKNLIIFSQFQPPTHIKEKPFNPIFIKLSI